MNAVTGGTGHRVGRMHAGLPVYQRVALMASQAHAVFGFATGFILPREGDQPPACSAFRCNFHMPVTGTMTGFTATISHRCTPIRRLAVFLLLQLLAVAVMTIGAAFGSNVDTL